MPILLQSDELEPGMRLSESVIWQGRRLLTAGKLLTHADVDILVRKYPKARARVADPILDDIVEFEDDSHDRNVAQTVQQRIASAMSKVSERFSSRASIASLNVGAVRDSVAEVLEYLRNNPVSGALLSQSLDTDNYLSEHAGNVFYLSMILGNAVREYVDAERRRTTACRWLDHRITMDLLPLGLGAMFCDLGMLPLQHLFSLQSPLTDDDRQAIREHPDAGAAMLPADFSATARTVVRTHHENFDGTGYPRGMGGSRIHVFSRIVRIADAYDASTAAHIYSEAKSPVRTLWEMTVGTYHRYYDPVLMKVFSRIIQPFPIGAKLLLRDGRYAVVVRYNREVPFNPVVMIAFDANGNRLAPSRLEGPLHLDGGPNLRIQSFRDEQLSYLYRTVLDEDLATGASDFHTLFDASYP